MHVQFDDPRLIPIRHKVEAGERLDFDDGLALFRTHGFALADWPPAVLGELSIV